MTFEHEGPGWLATGLLAVVGTLVSFIFKNEVNAINRRIDATDEANTRAIDLLVKRIDADKEARLAADNALLDRINSEVAHRNSALEGLEREFLTVRTRVHEMSNTISVHDATLGGVKDVMAKMQDTLEGLNATLTDLRVTLAATVRD